MKLETFKGIAKTITGLRVKQVFFDYSHIVNVERDKSYPYVLWDLNNWKGLLNWANADQVKENVKARVFIVDYFDQGSDSEINTREEIWDELRISFLEYVNSLNTNAYVQIKNMNEMPMEYYTRGISVDSEIGMHFEVEMDLYCGLGELPEPAPAQWYLASGIALSNIIAAYAAKGADSKVESRVNLITPGTRDAVALVDHGWNVNDGWIFNVTNQLYVPSVPLTDLCTVIMRWSGVIYEGGYDNMLFGHQDPDSLKSFFAKATVETALMGTIEALPESSYAFDQMIIKSIVFAFNKNGFYINGVKADVLDDVPGTFSKTTHFGIGAVWYDTGLIYNTEMNVQHFALYNKVLTDAQILNVTIAMLNE